MNLERWKTGVFAVAVLAAFGVRADEGGDRPLQIEYENIHYVVNDDGSYTESRETATRVLREQALEYAKNETVGYSTSIQKAEVLEAYTLKADGRRIAVPPGNYQVSASSGQQGDSPVYSDRSTLTVVFPELEVGDTTVFSYRLTASTPLFAGHFSVIESFSPATYYGDLTVSIDAPVQLDARHMSWHMPESKVKRAGDRERVSWHWRNREPVERETLRDSVFNVERYPGYAFSSFDSYAQIAQAYGGPANAKAAPTARVRELADEIAGDAREPRDVARRLYEWVSRNITYAGNCIGLGAVVPRDLDVVLDNRMGDCKDHATLLQALLTARGIHSTQALINAGGTYSLPDIPVASVVNHVITYIPDMELYLDSTAATVPFGSLPTSIAGKPVLLVEGHHADARTPANDIGGDGQKLVTRLRVDPDGSISGSQRLELNGRLAVAARDQFRDMPASDVEQLVKRYFQQASLKATGKVSFPDPKPLLEQFSIDAEFDVEKMLPVPAGIQVQPWFISFAPVSGVVAGNLGSDEHPPGESGCSGMVSEEQYELEFADGLRVVALPQDVSLEYEGVSYTASYRQEGNTVRVHRLLNDRTPGPVCSPEYNAGYAAMMRRIMPELRSQLIYLRAKE
ncbi:DUF3857 domain-containing protein [Marilutibacter maris]|uniref:DUF3857 domain-containing protein n=1 Tax=Marilutibacter maris TaxID=1605891 RepID=UPI0014793544|nr:DUF3857 domain-containing protein [Lysobacter maris]